MTFPTSEMLTGSVNTKEVRINSIRNLAADVHAETISDDEINIIAIKKDSKVFDLTNNSTWTDTDAQFPLVIDASNCYTATELLRGFADSQSLTEADALEKKADEIIKQLNNVSLLAVSSAVETTEGIAGEQKGTFN